MVNEHTTRLVCAPDPFAELNHIVTQAHTARIRSVTSIKFTTLVSQLGL